MKKDDYNYGFKIGCIFKPIYSLILSSNLKLNLPNLFLHCLKEFYPQRWQRLKGIADALGLNLKQLYANVFCLSLLFKKSCTAGFCSPSASKDGKSYLFWNIDFFKAARFIGKFLRFFLVDIPNNNCYFAFGIPGIITVPIINEFGLAVVSASVGMTHGGGEGLMDAEIICLCIERCKNIEEVCSVYKNTNLYSFPGVIGGNFINLNSIWADNFGNGVIIEHSSNYLHFEFANSGILAMANHHQFIQKISGSPTPDELPSIAGSYCRLGRMWNLLKQNKGNIDLYLIKKIMADHKLEKEHVSNYRYKEPIDDGTICVHYWHLKQYLKEHNVKRAIETYLMGETIGSLIIEPMSFIIHTCAGNPCKHNYRQRRLKPIFLNRNFQRMVSKSINPKIKRLSRKFFINIATLLEKMPLGRN